MATRALLLIALLCWVDSYFSTAASEEDAKVYHVKIGDEFVGMIQTKTRFILDEKAPVALPNDAEATGEKHDNLFFVIFRWDQNNTFKLQFKEEDKIVYLVDASLSINGRVSVTWKLGYNLGDSNSSYQCSAFFSVAGEDSNYAKLVMLQNRFQVFNFHGNFSNAIICPEDGPDMVTGHWILNTSEGIPCIRLQGAIAFNVTYETVEKHNASAKINLPPTAVVLPEESYCFTSGATVNTTKEQVMTIGFQDNWWLKFHFTRDSNVTKDDHNDHWLVDSVHLRFTYDKQHFPSARHPGTEREMRNEGSLGLFRTMKDRSFSCNALVETKVVDNFTLLTKSVQTQAFMYEEKYFPVESCAADIMTSDLVPIIIGAALAILIVVVLVAYLVGRARTRRQTYENI